MKRTVRSTAPHVQFEQPPPIGFRLTVQYQAGHAKDYTLERVEPYTRKRDGQDSFLLHWRDRDGEDFTSGLQSKSLTKMRPVRMKARARLIMAALSC